MKEHQPAHQFNLFYHPTFSDDTKKEAFAFDVNKVNYTKIQVISSSMFYIFIIIFLFDLYRYYSGFFEQSNYYYYLFYLHIFGFVGFGIARLIFRERHRAYWEERNLYYPLKFGIICFITGYMWVDSYIQLMNSFIPMGIVLGLLGVSTLLVFSRLCAISFILSGLVGFNVLVYIISDGSPAFVGRAISTLVLGIICFAITRVMEQLSFTDFNNRQIIEEKNIELVKLNEDLEQFVHVASHDMKAPLNQIASFCDLALNKIPDIPEQELRTYLTFASDGAKSLKELIDGLLEFSHIGNEKLTIVDIDLNIVVDDALDNLADEIQKSNVIIKVEDLPSIKGNKMLLTQLFQNLISNGIKYNDNDSKMLRIQNRSNGVPVVVVKDNGIGIDDDHKSQIFGLFNRLHGNSEYEGSGIGLAFCQKIVKLHNAELSVDSKVGEGSDFVLKFSSN